MMFKTRHKYLALAIATLLILLISAVFQAQGSAHTAFAQIATNTPAQSGETTQATPVVLTDQQQKYPLGLHLEILEDPTRKLTISDVASPPYDLRFTASRVAVPNYGLTDSAYWVRLDLENESSHTTDWLLELGFANTQYVDLYSPVPVGKGYTIKQTGILKPISSRDVVYPNIVFSLNLPSHSVNTYYIHLLSGASMTIPLTLWSGDEFFLASGRYLMLHWFFFGGILVLLLYHTFLLIALRETTYLYFVVLLASLFILVSTYTGFLGTYIIPGLYRVTNYIVPISLSLLNISIILFSDSFLELKRRFPRLHQVNLVLLGLWGVLFFSIPFFSYHAIAVVLSPWMLISLAATALIGIIAWRKGVRPVGFFMLAWLGMAAGLFLLMLVRQGLATSTYFSENIYQLGFILMAVCWSFALSDRINLYKSEIEVANRNLHSSERHLSQILGGLPLGVVVYGLDQKPKYLNKRAVEILEDPSKGIRPSIEAGRTLEQAEEYFSFQVAGTTDKYPVENLPVYKALAGEPAHADDIEANVGGKTVPLEIWASPVVDDAGNVDEAVAAFQDVTQRKELDAELTRYRIHLEELVKTGTAELDKASQLLQLRYQWLSEVLKIHPTIKGTPSLPVVYEELSSIIYQLLDAALVFIFRWESQSESSGFYDYTARGDIIPDIELIRSSFQNDSAFCQEIEQGKTITWTPDKADQYPLPYGDWLQENGFKLGILASMIIGQSLFGVLGIAVHESSQKSLLQQIDLVERMGFDLASLAQDAVLLDQALALAAVDERNRLARDLHDSVTQVLFSANLLAEVMPQIWRRDPEQGLRKLEILRQLTRGALAEMRTLLIELRPSSIINTPLSDLLIQLTEAVASRSGLEFKLAIEHISILPDHVQTNFYRIAQEALNNIVKHAQAIQVAVSLSEIPLPSEADGKIMDEIRLMIQDDGVGFYLGSEKPGHLGIGIMRERAAAIHASLSILSEPGHGTMVSLIWHDGSKSERSLE